MTRVGRRGGSEVGSREEGVRATVAGETLGGSPPASPPSLRCTMGFFWMASVYF
jgi:hypothetical protein